MNRKRLKEKLDQRKDEPEKNLKFGQRKSWVQKTSQPTGGEDNEYNSKCFYDHVIIINTGKSDQPDNKQEKLRNLVHLGEPEES